MSGRDHLKHNQTDGPQINRFSVQLATRHLLRRLISKCSTDILDALSGGALDRQTEVNQLCLAVLCDNDVAWFQVAVYVISLVHSAQPEKYAFDEFGHLVIS